MTSLPLAFPNESPAYRTARNALLEAEIALRRQTEAVAAARRALPPGGKVPTDYAFTEGDDARKVKMSELFGPHQALVAYSFMYGPKAEKPCPMCTGLLDGLDRVIPFALEEAGWSAMETPSPADAINSAAHAIVALHPEAEDIHHFVETFFASLQNVFAFSWCDACIVDQ